MSNTIFHNSASWRAIVVASGLALAGSALPAEAADLGLGGDCCADLEERVAELEATTARKGNRVVSLTLSGHVNKTLMFWDDGFEENVYVTDNDNSQSRVRWSGEAKIDADLSAGFLIEVSVADNNNVDVNAFSDDASGNNKLLSTRHVHWWIKSERLGKLSVGQQSPATDDLSSLQLGNVMTAASDGWNDGFNLYAPGFGTTDGYSDLVWGDLRPFYDPSRGDFVRYDSPSLHGFILSAAWGEDDYWDVALRYAKEWNAFRVAAGIGYAQSTDGTGGENLGCISARDFGLFEGKDAECDIVVGSISAMHIPTGLFLSFGAGQDTDDRIQAVVRSQGANFNVEDEGNWWYVSGGIERRWWSYGTTTFYGEFLDSEHASLGVLDADDALNASGATAFINDNDYSYWGIGAVQNIDAAAMELYVMYRNFEGELDLRDAAGDRVDGGDFEDMSVLFTGARIKF